MASKHVLAALPDRNNAGVVREIMGPGYRVDWAEDHLTALKMHQGRDYEFTFLDLEFLLDGQSGSATAKDALQPFQQSSPWTHIIVITNPERLREAVAAVKAGAGDYLTYPLDPAEVRHVADNLRNSVRILSELDYLRDQLYVSDTLGVARTNSPLMQKVYDAVNIVAPTRSTVLLTGETGTGKSLIAKLVHRRSVRKHAQFIAVHCGAIPESLLESELFGHVKGAFTGAVKDKVGKFEIAQGGAIFLDEIGTITPSAQVKLLQVLQDKTFQRVGGNTTLEADVRVIAASNVDLKAMTEQGQFRRDLLYRLNVFPIEIPPLAERKEDIPLLVEVFLKRLNQEETVKNIDGVQPEVMAALQKYDWPGNVRELENVIERAFIIEETQMLTPDSLPADFFTVDTPASTVLFDASLPLAEIRHRSMADLERTYLRTVLAQYRGSIRKTAEHAGITTRQLHKLMTKYGLKKEFFKNTLPSE
jgi:DNA-binding NtrC family response regulator